MEGSIGVVVRLQNQIIDSASIENGATASKAYASGDYVCFQGALCKASKAISQGDTLSIGDSANDNLTLTDAAAEFARINSNLSAKQNKAWNDVTYVSGSSTHFYVPSDAKEIEITALLYISGQNRSLKWLLTDNDMFTQIIYNGYYDGITSVACTLDVDGSNKIVGAGQFRYGDTLATPNVRARWR